MKDKRRIKHELPPSPKGHLLKVKTEQNMFAVLRVGSIALLILCQLVTFVVLSILLAEAFAWFMALSTILSLITTIVILSSDKPSDAKISWVIVILVFSYAGYIIYFLSDENVHFGLRKNKLGRIYATTNDFLPSLDVPESLPKQVRFNCNYLKQAGNFLSYVNTAVKYYPFGTMVFDDILDDLKKAQKFIYIEFFIINEGALFNRVMSILEDKVKAGVEVKIIYDDIGSQKGLSRKVRKRIRQTGIQLKAFNKLIPIFSAAMNFRDHRKFVIIDGEIAYTGGVNLADEYVGEKRIYGYWKDCGIRLEGDGVGAFTLAFLRQWQYLTDEKVDKDRVLCFNQRNYDGIVVPFVDGPDYPLHIGKDTFMNMISSAKDRLYIMTPYLIMGEEMEALLCAKARCGVDVKIIIPDVPDKKYVYLITKANAERLHKQGVKVYIMNDCFVHSKVLVSDDSAVVGSINMDMRSFYQQFESAVYFTGSSVKDVVDDVNESLKECVPVDYKRTNIMGRAIGALLRPFAPLM